MEWDAAEQGRSLLPSTQADDDDAPQLIDDLRRAVAAVCRSLGCRCVEAEVSPSEAWAPGLVKMQVFNAGADGGDAVFQDGEAHA